MLERSGCRYVYGRDALIAFLREGFPGTYPGLGSRTGSTEIASVPK